MNNNSLPNNENSILQRIYHPLFEERQINLFIKRDDLIHHDISGNKWRKLKFNVHKMLLRNQDKLVTFGGAYSNHLVATAAAGKAYGIKTIGIVRGEELKGDNESLKVCRGFGMELIFISRSLYREVSGGNLTPELVEKVKGAVIVPEGGYNVDGMKGCEEIVDEVNRQIPNDLPITYFSACGTGTTLGGIAKAMRSRDRAIGISVLKSDFHKKYINRLYDEIDFHTPNEWEISLDYHFGGYAKFSLELISYINNFKREFGLQFDPIYNGKTMFAAEDMLMNGKLSSNTNVVVVHTGGLQGIKGFNKRFNNLIIE